MTTFTFSLSREDCFDSGYLFDVTHVAMRAGFSLPVALTSDAFWRFLHVFRESELGSIDYTDLPQIPDMLNVCKHAIAASSSNDEIYFELVTPNGWLAPLAFKVVEELDDDLKPCLTIMLPTEKPL